jgi:2,3-bisphosphoglycerate-dependent phosphoglycerate mutase
MTRQRATRGSTTLYLIRHAQSHRSTRVHQSEFPLSTVGLDQARMLVQVLGTLGIEKIYSSPYRRCRETIAPFAEHSALEVKVHEHLHERLIPNAFHAAWAEDWRRSWEDFDLCALGGESQRQAQTRFVAALQWIAADNSGHVVGVSSHGNVIGLFLHHLDRSFDRLATDAMRNPDLFRVIWNDGAFEWDKTFRAAGIDAFGTHHDASPLDM